MTRSHATAAPSTPLRRTGGHDFSRTTTGMIDMLVAPMTAPSSSSTHFRCEALEMPKTSARKAAKIVDMVPSRFANVDRIRVYHPSQTGKISR